MLDTIFIKTLYDKFENHRKKKTSLLTGLQKNIIEFEPQTGEILKLSKQSINHCLNGRVKEAHQNLQVARNLIGKCDKQINTLKKKISVNIIDSTLQLKDLQALKLDQLENNLMVAKEEFLEAKLLFSFIKDGELYRPEAKNLEDFNSYMGGLCDFCGELVRKLRTDSVRKKVSDETFDKYLSLINQIYEELSRYSFTNASGNRNKIEQLKGHVKELEKIQYEQKHHNRSE